MIEIKDLSQSYKKKQVLKDINLTVEKNEYCALVGRNGAGKSTLIRSILGLQPVKNGSITLGGYSNNKGDWKKIVSYLPEKFHLYPHLTGEENMRFFASLGSGEIDEKKIEEKLKLVSLWDDRHNQVKGYSKGMLQRLGLCVMLYYDTEVLILDEPTSGLDPLGREEILQILKSLSGKTIFMASHHMDEIKQICTHVAFLEDGKMTKYTVDEFLNEHLKGADTK
ncbi:ABC transporter ATP-binding protein [Mesobacillus subterraneus]|uniref:ABC transporter ATP-binding protein n=1 Tax=Mesobacillus subterraneus TaxID=285983 RepID=UPI00203C383D|nr:ABC transporter ATP-binding protein [Mesobacillus subterraneus]MCM3664531.1 ABC transporter ATP-binding protein [Mesobacillus subterraneus]MCM3683953.1 ABC transporter ATP-binding protein [Mesobacillus subterraneus]